jgi:hypothetical protein
MLIAFSLFYPPPADYGIMNREESLRVMQLIRSQSARDLADLRTRCMVENAMRNGVPIQSPLQYQAMRQQGGHLAGASFGHANVPQMTVNQQSPSLLRYLELQGVHQWMRQKEREQRGIQIREGPSAINFSQLASQLQSSRSTGMLEHCREEVSVMNIMTHSGSAVATALDDNGPRCLPAPASGPMDVHLLSMRQVFLRQQIEIFAATEVEAFSHARGRNKRIQFGQVGIRCRHCAHMSVVNRPKGSTYFPSALAGLYQAAQNMCSAHLQTGVCTGMPESIQQEFTRLLSMPKACSGSGRKYWAESAKRFGLVDTDQGIFQSHHIPSSAHIIAHH